MFSKFYLSLVITVFVTFFAGANIARAQNTTLEYHGFKVNFAEISQSPQKTSVLETVKRQIDITEQVGLSSENLEFFKSVPIVMLEEASGTPGIYSANKKTVFLKGKDLADNKPILLHEFLHAYHHQKRSQSFQNEKVIQFFMRAQEVFPNFKGEYFLSNNREFFAVTASIYLFGNIPRPPFNRANIKEKQPFYYQYLATLFGEREP